MHFVAYCNTPPDHNTLVYCNTTLAKPPAIAIHISAHCTSILQYNFPANYTKAAIQFPSCNTLSLAIQALLLQYNSLPTRLGHNTISTTQTLLLQYKTKLTTLPRVQYNFPIAIQFQANYTILLQYNPLPKRLIHNTIGQ